MYFHGIYAGILKIRIFPYDLKETSEFPTLKALLEKNILKWNIYETNIYLLYNLF